MTSHVESLWLFAIASKCRGITNECIACSILFGALAWLAITFLFWAHPGGPAWGHYSWRRSLSLSSSPCNTKAIPGPRGLPLLGSMNLMLHLAHHRISAAAHRYSAKRLMAFSLGDTRIIVTCNHDVAREILSSSVFADRPVKESAYALMFNRAIGFAPYGIYWRTLRRIAATHLFCPKQIKASESQRRIIASQMVSLFACYQGPLTVRQVLKRASLNNMMGSVFGRSYDLNSTQGEAEELKGMVDEGYELLGKLNWSDHLPWLADLDPQKIKTRCSKLVPKVNDFVGRIVAEHRSQPSIHHRDFVDVLLSLQGPGILSDCDIIAVLWEMIFRGTDTVAVLIEWVLARIVMHAEVQERVHRELDEVVGRSNQVTESDIAAMAYLPAVVKEVLRLHPPGPLLSWARLATADTAVDGHHVPAGTTAMVNMWAISRDPQVWEDPLAFLPHRFINSWDDSGSGIAGEAEFSVLGSDLRLAPFGSGRRACPGKTLAMTTVTYWVARLLQEFQWLPGTGTEEKGKGVDLSEVLRLSCEMATPLTVTVRPRRPITMTTT